MPKNDFLSQRTRFIEGIDNLINVYEKKAQCCIFFKLNEAKSPLDILGVLDFLKYKIKKWGNSNIFSYFGNLFEDTTVFVVGAGDIEEAKSIMIYMFLSNILVDENKIDDFLENQGSYNDLEQFLNTEFTKNAKTGYPVDPILETKLIKHLEKLIMS